MANNVTATIGITKGMVTILNKSDRTFTDVPYQIFSDDISNEKFATIAERAFRNDNTKVFIDSKITEKRTAKFSMESWKFIANAHIISEKESKADKITRTFNTMSVKAYVAVKHENSAPTLETKDFYIEYVSDGDKLVKQLEKESKANGVIFVDIQDVKTYNTLYGMSKELFIANATESEAC